MLKKLKLHIGSGFVIAADVAGVALSGSGAAIVAFFGKLMLAVVLAAVALGFFLRLTSRRRAQVVVSSPIAMWSCSLLAALAVVEVGLIVEATNFPVRFDQSGFALWHWALVVVALAIAYSLNLRVLNNLIRMRHVAEQAEKPADLALQKPKAMSLSSVVARWRSR